ncbi:MAG TPA: hypothetical protein VJ835_10775 [Fimbriimonadaceae bacterium]|nr:hypothetical protein [Fimbriimonadaceae bacterium]
MSHEPNWANSSDWALLEQLFGRAPTLSEVQLIGIRFHTAAPTVEMDVVISDSLEESSERMTVLATFTWTNVESLSLEWSEDAVIGIEFRKVSSGYRTEFIAPFEHRSHIISGDVEVRLKKVDPLLDPDERHRIRIEYR